MLPHYPDIMMGRYPSDPDYIRVVMPSDQEDFDLNGIIQDVITAYGSSPEDGYRLEDRIDSFYKELNQMQRVIRLYRLDLGASLTRIPSSIVLDKVSSFRWEKFYFYS